MLHAREARAQSDQAADLLHQRREQEFDEACTKLWKELEKGIQLQIERGATQFEMDRPSLAAPYFEVYPRICQGLHVLGYKVEVAATLSGQRWIISWGEE
ncbi:hypothetical protein P67b_00075 [Ruegeria phage Tedan]|nr:hypothetical protein P67b_00075 [Ruegeria phage Tedan]